MRSINTIVHLLISDCHGRFAAVYVKPRSLFYESLRSGRGITLIPGQPASKIEIKFEAPKGGLDIANFLLTMGFTPWLQFDLTTGKDEIIMVCYIQVCLSYDYPLKTAFHYTYETLYMP